MRVSEWLDGDVRCAEMMPEAVVGLSPAGVILQLLCFLRACLAVEHWSVMREAKQPHASPPHASGRPLTL